MEPSDEQEAQPRAEGRPDRVRAWRVALVLIVGMLLVLVVYDTIRADQPRMTVQDVNTAVARAMASATPPPARASLIYQALRPSVVAIETTDGSGQGKTDEGGLGTGVVVDQSGLILTALHVVQGASRIDVLFADGSKVEAKVVSQQPQNDIAVIQVSQLPPFASPAVLGDPSTVHVGDEAIVIGNPFGLVGSLSTGSISGLGRTFIPPEPAKPITNVIQFDAAVNPGNSGGPLLNRDGEVVGIVTGLANPTKDNVYIGIGFAVPISTAGGALGDSPF